jgi:hypothetical protein
LATARRKPGGLKRRKAKIAQAFAVTKTFCRSRHGLRKTPPGGAVEAG